MGVAGTVHVQPHTPSHARSRSQQRTWDARVVCLRRPVRSVFSRGSFRKLVLPAAAAPIRERLVINYQGLAVAVEYRGTVPCRRLIDAPRFLMNARVKLASWI